MSPFDNAQPEAVAPSPIAQKRRRWPRIAVVALSVLVALVLVGVLVQVVLERRDAAAHPPPGDLVALPDGRRLHLQVSGGEKNGPVVVLEAGAGAFSSAWAWIQPAVAKRYPVVSYDRAGLGWSDFSPNGPDAEAVVADLWTALQTRGLDGPYILVGHSLGGHYVRAFAAAHADEVAGVVLVDPSHEHQASVLGEDYMAGLGPMFTAVEFAARLGLTRVYNPMTADVTLPETPRRQVEAKQRTVQWVQTAGAEMTAIDKVGAQVADQHLGDIPLRVLIAGHSPNESGQEQVDAMVPLRREMAMRLSTNGRALMVPDADHITVVTDREFAAEVSGAIMEVADIAATSGRG